MQKTPILLIILNYRTRSFIFIFRFHTKTRRFFYQKLSVGVYSTSEADTIVIPIWLSVFLPWKYQLLWNWISYFVYVLVTAPLLFAIRCKLTCPYINIMLYIFSFALNMHREFLQFMVSKNWIKRLIFLYSFLWYYNVFVDYNYVEDHWN